MANKKNREFQVQARLSLLVTASITAKDPEEAIQKAKTLEESDFVDIHGDYMDGNFRVTGVYESNPEL